MQELSPGISVHEGASALVISIPHAGTLIPAPIKDRMKPEALFLPDTDWFVDRLYHWGPTEGASMVRTEWSRYVIDLNRPPDDAPLYARHPATALVPEKTFQGTGIYREGRGPDRFEIEQRLEEYWSPYHDQLDRLVRAARDRHGYAILVDGHSIRSELPGLFEGELPNLNLGSAGGTSAASSLVDTAMNALENAEFSIVRDGRFQGGYITRHYGRPRENVHAIQLEIAQRTYMEEFPPHWDLARARALIDLLKNLAAELQAWRPEQDS